MMNEITSCILLDPLASCPREEDTGVRVLPTGANGPILHLQGNNWTLSTADFMSLTDLYDTLVTETRQNLYHLSCRNARGRIFFLENHETDEAIFLASEAPEYVEAALQIQGGDVTLDNDRNGVAVGFTRRGACHAFCRGYFRSHLQYKVPVSMSNTWGDGNGRTRVSEEFVLREIAEARKMGLDAMQIDDGWQKGHPGTCLRDDNGHRVFSEDFWALEDKNFPGGMKAIMDAAKEAGVRIGLWFAPDSRDNYALLDRDLAVLRRAYTEWGVRFFKLDMYWITNTAERDRFSELLRGIYAFGPDVSVELDVTAEIRVNYLFAKEYGTVFVENRYTKWGSFYPYRTLRNLWTLGRYLPTVRFQFELVNPDLYTDRYPEGDPFAPVHCDMDYLFASVMVSSPLFWMELQHLSEERKAQLKPLMDCWHTLRPRFADADICPIGEEPNGRSLTGFHISCKERPSYLLLLREVTERTEFVYTPAEEIRNVRLLQSNDKVTVVLTDDGVKVTFGKERAYALLEIE